MQSLILTGTLALVALSLLSARPAVAQEGPIFWDADSAFATGNGCDRQNTVFISAGNEIAVVFSNMGVDLVDRGGPNAAQRKCFIRVPVEVDPNVVVGSLTQQIGYGYAKTTGTRGEIRTRSKFFDLNARSFEIAVTEAQAGALAYTMDEVTESFGQRVKWCDGRGKKTTLMVDFLVNGKRSNRDDSISFRIYGEDLLYNALIEWARCPS